MAIAEAVKEGVKLRFDTKTDARIIEELKEVAKTEEAKRRVKTSSGKTPSYKTKEHLQAELLLGSSPEKRFRYFNRRHWTSIPSWGVSSSSPQTPARQTG